MTATQDMKKSSHFTHWFIRVVVAGLIGLISARLDPSAASPAVFSWGGFAAGAGLVVAAQLLARQLLPVARHEVVGSRAQRICLALFLGAFLSALVAAVLTLYTVWHWPRILAAVSIVIGGLAILAVNVIKLIDRRDIHL